MRIVNKVDGSMFVSMVDVRHMLVRMRCRFVCVLVGVRLAAVPSEIVRMPVMRIMNMRMRVLERSVRMLVPMPFGEMQPDPDGHQDSGDPECRCGRLAQQHKRYRRTHERSHRKVRAGTCRAEVVFSYTYIRFLVLI